MMHQSSSKAVWGIGCECPSVRPLPSTSDYIGLNAWQISVGFDTVRSGSGEALL